MQTFSRTIRKIVQGAVAAPLLFAGFSNSSNFSLNDYGLGSGGTASGSSSHYSAQISVGEVNGNGGTSTNYLQKTGSIYTQQADVPPAPSVDTAGGSYNKLHFVLRNGGNPADAKYAIAISADGFTTTQYIKNDGTVESALNLSDYQTYAAWGGASGMYATGLQYGTTYAFKVKASRGQNTITGFGPSSSATTSTPSVSFTVALGAQTTPPFNLSFGSLSAGSVTSSPQQIVTTLTTNAVSGANISVADLNGGLVSGVSSSNILSSSTDLSASSLGYGAQISSVTTSSGGPLTALGPYNGTGAAVGVLSSLPRSIFTASSPLNTGTGNILLKAKASSTLPSASDYADTITLGASANF